MPLGMATSRGSQELWEVVLGWRPPTILAPLYNAGTFMVTRQHLISCLLSMSLIMALQGPVLASSTALASVVAIGDMADADASTATFTAILAPSKDNTLYEDLDGALSNGAGQYFFVGNTNQTTNAGRRGLIKFDVAAKIPAVATILSATLHLTMSQTIAAPQPIRLHRVLVDWGEGASNASGGGGAGAPASPGDATWIHTFYTPTLWTTPGGDFVFTASATTTVGAVGAYNWTSTGVVSDVVAWLSAPAMNYGWLLSGNEGAPMTAKRFQTKEHPTQSARPVLVVTYTVPYAVYLPTVLNQK